MASRFLAPALLLLAASCGSAPAEPVPAVPEPRDPDPAVIEDPESRTGRVMLECDTHLRAWIQLVARERTDENQENIAFAATALARVVAREKDVLLAEAVSGPPRNRGIASAALGFSTDPDALPVLANNATDEEVFVASKAMLAIGVLCDPETPTTVFAQALRREDRTEELTRNLAFALYQLAEKTREDIDGRMAPVLLALLDEPDAGVRWQAAAGLGLTQATIGIPGLTDLLAGDPSDEVRTVSAWSLGLIGSPGSTRPLMRALDDPDEICAGAARAALKRIHGEDRGPDASSWEPFAKP